MKNFSFPKRLSLFLIFLFVTAAATATLAKDKDRGYLGVMLQNVSTSMAKALQLDDGEGVMISEIVADGPADEAGLEDGDVILKFNGETIDDYKDLTTAVRATAPGDKINVQILRSGERQTKKVEMGEAEERSYTYTIQSGDGETLVDFLGDGGEHEVIVMPGGGHSKMWTDDGGHRKVIIMSGDDHEGAFFGEDHGKLDIMLENFAFNEDRGFMGVELDDLDEQLGEYFGVKDGEGALITSVREDSPAADAGLKAGDVITSVNGDSVDDASGVHEAMAETESEQKIEVKVVRKGRNKTLKVTLGEMPENEFIHQMRLPHAPKMMKHFKHGGDFDIHMSAPHAPRKIRKIHRFVDDQEDFEELRQEFDEMRQEMKKLKEELEK